MRGKALPREGSRIELTTEYVHQSWDNVYALGVITLHLTARSEALHLQDKDAEETNDYWLINSAYWAIQQQRFGAAAVILRYASRLHLSKGTCKLMVVVNLAQTMKWQGEDDECKKILASEDWNAANSEFKLCAAVLRGDADIEKLLVNAVAECNLSLDSLYEWPVFTEFRKRPDFAVLAEKAFGPGWKPPTGAFPAVVLNFRHHSTWEELQQLIQRHERRELAGPNVREGITSDEGTEDSVVH